MIPLNWVQSSPKQGGWYRCSTTKCWFLGKKSCFCGQKSKFFWKSTKSFVTIIEGHQKDNILVLTLLYGELWGDRRAHFWPGNMHLLQSHNHLATIFWGQADPTQWDPKSLISWGNFGYLRLLGRRPFGWLAGCFMALIAQNYSFGAKTCSLLHPRCCDLGNNKTCNSKNTPLNFCIRLTHEEPLH